MNEENDQTPEQTDEQTQKKTDPAQSKSGEPSGANETDELRQAGNPAEEVEEEDPEDRDEEEAESDEDAADEVDDDELPEVKARDAEIEEIKNCEIGNTPNLSKRHGTGILMGTVETYDCDPEEDCPECETRKVCQQCQGDGTVTCPHCGGQQDCPTCNGSRVVPCPKCDGSGSCRKCGGSGAIRCSSCHGKGQVKKCRDNGTPYYITCHECNGRGQTMCSRCRGGGQCQHCHGRRDVTCGDCDGAGRCSQCGGRGVVTCGNCDGSGQCPTCNGHGRITCHRCQGTGFYQQYIGYKAKGITKNFQFCGSRNIKGAIEEAVGTVLYNDAYKQWINEDTLKFDRTKEAMAHAIGCDEPLFREFEAAYGQFAGEHHPSTAEDRPVNKAIRIQEIPVTRVEYVVDDNPYVLYIMGINSIVAFDKMPKKIEALRAGLFSKAKMLFTKKSRARNYAKLAAYVFACDGLSIEESRLMNLAIKKLRLPEEEEKAFRESLKKFTSSMPYEEFRKEVKSLFDSKKTLAFAWQCMSIDKHVSEAETELFNKLLAEFKLRPEHGEPIKAFAKRIATLSDGEIIDEYLHN